MSDNKHEVANVQTGDCPPSEEILALVAGRLPPRRIGPVIRHISSCRDCCDMAQAAGLDASLVALLQRQAEEVLDETSTSNRTQVPSAVPAAPRLSASHREGAIAMHSSSSYAFLSPGQSSEELGRLGPYRILKILGEGGMGIVFEAEDPQLQRRVAVKVLRPGRYDESIRQRFLQEARLAASLNSDLVVTIHQVCDDPNSPYMVMELLEGESLDSYLTRKGTLPFSEALLIARKVAEGLCVVHSKSLVHRDIKPGNIWLERTGDPLSPFRVKLLDFGIARTLNGDSKLTMEGRIVGTPSYMCPEQACGQPLTARSDLFSLGCVLWAMLAGESPFARENSMLSIRAVAEADLPAPRERLPNVPQPLIDLVTRLLSKDPADRYEDARQVVDQIRAIEAWQVVIGTNSADMPTIVNAVAPIRRRRMGLGAWIGVAVFVMAALIGILFEINRFMTAGPNSDNPQESAKTNPSVADPANQGVPAVIPVVASRPPLKVGILHSLTGPMAASERSVVDAFVFAIDEINAAGGLLGGRQIEPVIRDGKSYDNEFARQALDLIDHEKVVSLFGVWRSSCRQLVEKVCQEKNYLLVYPASYEGLEESPHVIYMGGTANQQITPGIKWAYAFLGKRKFFLVGTDGMFSRGSHEIISDELAELGASVVGNEYHSVSDTDFSAVARQIVESEADIVVNTVVGLGNIHLFASLRKVGIKADSVPVLSLNVTEEELRSMAPRGELIAGNYSTLSYCQSLKTPLNEQFIARFHKRFGSTRVVTDPMVAAYNGMHLWALAVQAAQSEDVDNIRREIVLQKFEGPEGLITIDPKTQNAKRYALIGEVNKHFEFDVAWTSPRPVDPQPYPPTRTPAEWDEFVRSVRTRYGHRWSTDYDPQSDTTTPTSNP